MSPRILIITPAPRGSRQGNRVTAERLVRLLRPRGFSVAVAEEFSGQTCDVLVALHARKSAPSIDRLHRKDPDRPLIVVLTGTDLYHDLPRSAVARRSLELATRIVVLQPNALNWLSKEQRKKATAIIQSATPPNRRLPPRPDCFEVAVIGHLRTVKDPFRTVIAVNSLLPTSRVVVTQIGGALDEKFARRAERKMKSQRRYHWLGELSQAKTLQILSRCRLLSLTSKLEGGANVIGEAIVAGVPVVSSRTSGSIGLLGHDYPGFFEYGESAGLAKLLMRAETDLRFYQRLKSWCDRLRPQFDPAREAQAWHQLLNAVLAGSDTLKQVRARNQLSNP